MIRNLLLCFLVSCAFSLPVHKTEETTEKPCNNVSDQQRVLECAPLTEEFENKVSIVMSEPTKVDDPRVLELIDLCGRIKACSENNCYFPESLSVDIETSCSGIQLKNTEFFVCLSSLKKSKLDAMKYPCLADVESGDEIFTTNTNCTKIVMNGICGPNAVIDFDKNIETMNHLSELDEDSDEQ